MVYWKNVPYGNGGDIVAVARINGKEVARHKLETAGKATQFKLIAENANDWQADGMDLQYVRVYAVDSKGRMVPTFDQEVSFNVEGAATLKAVDNGDHSTNAVFTASKIKMHKGFAMLF